MEVGNSIKVFVYFRFERAHGGKYIKEQKNCWSEKQKRGH